MAVSRICSVPECGKRAIARGWCALHYQRWQKGVPFDQPVRLRGVHTVCLAAECSRKPIANGYCSLHWQRLRHGTPMTKPIKTPNGAVKKFVEQVMETDTNECIFWPFARSPDGYAVMTRDFVSPRAHRQICWKKHGPPPTSKHHAAHSCGKGHLGCVNWKHVRWATPQENIDDKLIHGTQPMGEAVHLAILTAVEVAEIKKRLLAGETQVSIAADYGVTDAAIGSINLGKNWKSVPWPAKET